MHSFRASARSSARVKRRALGFRLRARASSLRFVFRFGLALSASLTSTVRLRLGPTAGLRLRGPGPSVVVECVRSWPGLYAAKRMVALCALPACGLSCVCSTLAVVTSSDRQLRGTMGGGSFGCGARTSRSTEASRGGLVPRGSCSPGARCLVGRSSERHPRRGARLRVMFLPGRFSIVVTTPGKA